MKKKRRIYELEGKAPNQESSRNGLRVWLATEVLRLERAGEPTDTALAEWARSVMLRFNGGSF